MYFYLKYMLEVEGTGQIDREFKEVLIMWGITIVRLLILVRSDLVFALALGLCAVSAYAQQARSPSETESVTTREHMPPWGVFPPFQLRDEEGNVINPVMGENIDKPYSPKQTCGQCHDYDKITQGYHFMQGKGEEPTADQKDRCLWSSTPGNYGGTWCSPAPLYPYLSPK